jgi:2-polyprenyl-3-methyl-5-hydroxy-6-metoxy-1,4-benzoquinol methylase
VIWRCPVCRGALAEGPAALECAACKRSYDVVAGIPDLRVDVAAWVDFADDVRRAHELNEATEDGDVEAAIRFVFAQREDWSSAFVERRTRQVLSSSTRLRAELDGWLAPLLEGERPLLDLGCGPGTLLATAASRGRTGIGIDVSLEWLVVAQRMIDAAGGNPVLACALAEALPLADQAVGAVAVVDVVEHVSDPARLVREVDRVLVPGGAIALATPNRYSLSAEPHVGVWGVGWLPRRWQGHYVARRTGRPYDFARLLGSRELERLFHRHSSIDVRVEPGLVPAEELASFSARRRRLARAYNALASALPGWLLRPICPFFHVSGRRRAGVEAASQGSGGLNSACARRRRAAWRARPSP